MFSYNGFVYCIRVWFYLFFFFFQAEDGIRDWSVNGVQTCALPIYRGRDEHVGLAAHELDHGGLELALLHLAVRHDHPRLRHQLLDEARHRGERLHAVVDEEDLAAAFELARERLLDHRLAEPSDDRLDRQPVERRSLDHRHVS